jgi:hypothetical protein
MKILLKYNQKLLPEAFDNFIITPNILFIFKLFN